MSPAEYSCKFFKPIFAYRQTVWTQIRLLLKEQSDLGPHCLQKWLLKSQADDKADDNCCDWQFKSEVLYFSYWNCTGFLFFSSEPEEWLTFTTLWANSANNKSIFFFFFPPPRKWNVKSCFLGKIRKIISMCHLLNILPTVLSIKYLIEFRFNGPGFTDQSTHWGHVSQSVYLATLFLGRLSLLSG